jgi:hypothetical protein
MPGPAVTRIFCHLARASVRVPVAGPPAQLGRGPALACRVAIPETEPVTERLQVREIDDDEGRSPSPSLAGHDLPFSTWSLAKLAESWWPRGGR